MSLRFRPQLESLERRETPSPIGSEPVNPLDPPAQTAPPPTPGDPSQSWFAPAPGPVMPGPG